MGIVLKVQVFGYATQCRLVVVDVSEDVVPSSGSSTFRNVGGFTSRHDVKKAENWNFQPKR
jgi:pyruvate carboxylase